MLANPLDANYRQGGQARSFGQVPRTIGFSRGHCRAVQCAFTPTFSANTQQESETSSPRPSTAMPSAARVSKTVSKAARPKQTRAAFPLLRAGGQGRGRTADLPLSGTLSPRRPNHESPCCPPQRHLRRSPAISAIVSTVPGYTAEFRFVCGIPVGIATRARSCGDFVGRRAGRRRPGPATALTQPATSTALGLGDAP